MNDLAYLAILIAFFALAALFVLACDRIVGADEATAAPPATVIAERPGKSELPA